MFNTFRGLDWRICFLDWVPGVCKWAGIQFISYDPINRENYEGIIYYYKYCPAGDVHSLRTEENGETVIGRLGME